MKKRKILKIIVTYLLLTLVCLLFSIIYEHFSHGVYSDYMVYMFAIPLFGGVLPFGVIGVVKFLPLPKRLVTNLYNSGIATLTIGSCLSGALAIYGTTSDLILIYWFVGISFLILAMMIYLVNITRIIKNI